MGKTSLVRGISSLVIILSLIFQQTGFAQMAAQIDLSGYLGGLKSSSVQDVYRPAHLRYFSYDNLTDNFKLLLEKGDFFEKQSMVYPDTSVGTGSPLSIDKTKTHEHKNSRTQELKQETKKLMKYFLTGVSLPDDMFWVNLRPDSQDQVIDSWLEKTDVGRIMLEADLQLKKDTAMFTSPETTLGRKYWDKLYKKAAELYGYDNVTIPTLTRPWIVPGEIIVRETKDSAYVYKAVLKVMLEEDYLKNNTVGAALVSAQYEFNDPRAKELNKYSTQLIRELIIPKLTKEINSSKRYSALRQVYYSLILSRWFKMRFSGKQGAYSSLINSSNLTNLTSSESWSKNTYFKQYQKSFSEGEYNIKEPVSTPTGQVIRSYFSGGIQVGPNMGMNVFRTGNNMLYEVLEGMPGIVPIQGMANLGLANLRILPMGKAANRNSLDGIKTTIKSALDKFKAKIQERAAVVAASSSVRFSSAKELVEQLEQKFSDRLKQGNQVVVQEIKQYYDGLGVDDQQIAYEYLQAHESALAADALSAIGLPWNGVVKALVAKIRGEKTGNPRAAARQLNELATKGTCAGLIPPTREIVSEAQRVWSENPQFAGLTKQIEFPEFPVLQADKPGILVLDRHGETYRSVEVLNRWSGGLDTKVTRKGLAEAFESGSSLKGIKFDKAYASALSRAQDTLKQVLLATDQTDIEILTDPAINERNYGTGGMEGWRRSEVERVFGKKVLTKWRRGYDTDEDRPFGGENLLDVQERSVPYFLKNIMVDIAQGKTVIISAHGNSLRAILIELRQHIDNAQVPKAEIEELEVPLSEPIVINFDNKLRVVDIKGPQKVTSFFKLPNVQVQNGKVSSSTQAMPENAGAIDFRGRAMNINYQAMGSFKGLDLKLPRLSSIELNKINIDSEIQQIKKMVSSGISPSGRRIIELAAACEQKGKMSVYSRDLLLCVVGACELAEVNADESSRDFMIALAAIDSRS